MLQPHDYCKLFPACSEEDYNTLKESIEKNGLLEPIVLFDGEILDGRNRYEACRELGIEPETVEYDGDDPLAYVIAKNFARRHLNSSQKAIIAAEMANMKSGRRTDLPKTAPQLSSTLDDSALEIPERNEPPANLPEVSQSEAAGRCGVSERGVREAVKLLREAPSEIVNQVKQGEKTVHAALKEIGQPVPGKDGKVRPARYKPRKKTVAKASESESGRSITVKLDRFAPVTVHFPLPEDDVKASRYVMEAFGVTDNPERLKDIAKDLVAFGLELQEFAAWLDRIFD